MANQLAELVPLKCAAGLTVEICEHCQADYDLQKQTNVPDGR